ncbi:MAG: hypothetical protein ABR928_12555 [Terracidiphilus sp.]|jgi:hypothetical protein
MSAVPLFEPTIVALRLIVSPALSDLEFGRFCLKSDSVQIERTPNHSGLVAQDIDLTDLDTQCMAQSTAQLI